MDITNFVKLYDNWGTLTVLNVANIIRIKEFPTSMADVDSMSGVKSQVEYGSGFLDVVYMSEDVQGVYEIIQEDFRIKGM